MSETGTPPAPMPTLAGTGILSGKRGVIMGLANQMSIAWGIAEAMAQAGAHLSFTYQGGVLEKRVRPLVEKLGPTFPMIVCDVTDADSVDQAFAEIGAQGPIDFVVHAIAYSDKDQLDGRYVDTTPENFRTTMDISVYSFTHVCRAALPHLTKNASLITLTYYGAERVIPHYNVMGVAKAALEASVRYLAADLGPDGIRVNAISAGPIRTLAASGISHLKAMLKWNELNSPLGHNVTIQQVGQSAVYLASDLSSAVTGETHHVDAGYHCVGMAAMHNAAHTGELMLQYAKAKGLTPPDSTG